MKRIGPQKNSTSGELLAADTKESFRWEDGKLTYSSSLRPWHDGVVELLMQEAGRDRRFTKSLPLWACQLRVSTFSRSLESIGDSIVNRIKGNIVGCPLSKDWWVREMQMFDGMWRGDVFDGFLDPATGKFSITASLSGVRHILIIARGI